MDPFPTFASLSTGIQHFELEGVDGEVGLCDTCGFDSSFQNVQVRTQVTRVSKVEDIVKVVLSAALKLKLI